MVTSLDEVQPEMNFIIITYLRLGTFYHRFSEQCRHLYFASAKLAIWMQGRKNVSESTTGVTCPLDSPRYLWGEISLGRVYYYRIYYD
jgi:hypothetical protein